MVASWLGFKFAPYTGVMFNATIMGLVGAITVQIGRDLFGDDPWRLRRIGTIVAANGLFILFGAVLLRDCFNAFFMTLVIWGAIRLLVRAKIGSLIFMTAMIGISAWALQYLRGESFLLVFLYGFLAILLWFFKRSGFAGSMVTFLFVVSFLGSAFLSFYIQDVTETQVFQMERYTNIAIAQGADDSLGVRFVYNQPLPIRLVLGSVSLMITPIPLWAHFRIGALDYHWIKGYNGIYQLFVLPLVFAGSLAAFRTFFRDTKRSWPLIYLVMFVIINMFGVAATSIELRHLGQFMSAVVIIAAMPDTREQKTEKALGSIKAWWFFGVLLVHIAWGILKIV